MNLTKVLNSIRLNMCRCLVQEPCTHDELLKRPEFRFVSLHGLNQVFKELVSKKIINEDSTGILTVREDNKHLYSDAPESVF